MATDATPSVCPVRLAIHSYGYSDCHILIVLSELPLTIFEFGNMANEETLSLCPFKVILHSYGYSDCHILIV
jgi:hypothetical protein